MIICPDRIYPYDIKNKKTSEIYADDGLGFFDNKPLLPPPPLESDRV